MNHKYPISFQFMQVVFYLPNFESKSKSININMAVIRRMSSNSCDKYYNYDFLEKILTYEL